MKKMNLFMTATFMLIFFVVNAQNTEKGDKIIGLGLGFGNNFTLGGAGFSNSFLTVSAFMEAIVKDDLFGDGKGAIGLGGFAQYMNYKYLISNIPPKTNGGVVSVVALKAAQASTSSYNWKYNKFIIGPRGYLHYSFLDNLFTNS